MKYVLLNLPDFVVGYFLIILDCGKFDAIMSELNAFILTAYRHFRLLVEI